MRLRPTPLQRTQLSALSEPPDPITFYLIAAPAANTAHFDPRAQLQVMKATTKDLKQQFKSKDLDINAIEKMRDEMVGAPRS